MRRLSLIFIAGTFYFSGISNSCADYVALNYLYPDDAHMQAVSQALDKIESSQNSPLSTGRSALVRKTNEFDFSSELYWAKFNAP